MADGGISIAGLVLATQALVTALVNYALSTKGAKAEIQALTTELSALRGILECIQDQRKALAPGSNPQLVSRYSSESFLQGECVSGQHIQSSLT